LKVASKCERLLATSYFKVKSQRLKVKIIQLDLENCDDLSPIEGSGANYIVKQPSGLKMRSVAAGYFSNKFAGRIGRLTNSPPQLGHFPRKLDSAQIWQKVHSKEQTLASTESGGKSLLQHSQLGRSCSIDYFSHNKLLR